MLRRFVSLPLVLAFAWAAGCAGPRGCDPSCAGMPHPQDIFDCEPTERLSITPDVSAVAAREQITEPLPPDYCLLEEQDAQCLAVNNAPLANLFEQEASALRMQVHPHVEQNGVELTAAILRRLAAHERNEAAARTLTLFLRLTEAEGAADNLAKRVEATDSILSSLGALRAQGLVPPVTPSEIAARRLELLHQQVELRITRDQLHAQLVEQLDVSLLDNARFWPRADLVVSADRPAAEPAIDRALAQRADLAALRLAIGTDDRSLLFAGRRLLQSQNPALGSASAACLFGLLQADARAGEAAVRRRQLADLLADQELAVSREVQQAAQLISERLDQIALTRARVGLARQHVASITQQQELSGGGLLPVREAQLKLLDAELDLLHDVIEWKIAVVQFKQAQGLLALECLAAGCFPY